MTATIEPTRSPGVDPDPTGTSEAQPSIIPSVARHTRAGTGTTVKVVFLIAGAAVAALSTFLIWRAVDRPAQAQIAKAPPAQVVGSGAVKPLDMTVALPPSNAGTEVLPSVPAIEADGAPADPIGVHATTTAPRTAVPAGPPAASGAGAPIADSEDAPILLTGPGEVSGSAVPGYALKASEAGATDPLAQTRASLAQYQQQLGQSLESLRTMTTAAAAGGLPASGTAPAAGNAFAPPGATLPGATLPGAAPASAARGVLGLQASDTAAVRAAVLGDRNLVLPKGTSMTCALTTRIVSAQAGFIGCQVLRNVFSDNGKVLLIERGSHLDGEYRVTQVRPGTSRIPALWTRLRTPDGVTIDLDSPATGPLGESGADAFVDNRWFERVGAAMLVSIIDDSLKIVLNNETAPAAGNNSTVFQGTGQTASKMAEKVLDATINLPPLMYANQGAQVGVYVARDIDFSSVYELRPVAQ